MRRGTDDEHSPVRNVVIHAISHRLPQTRTSVLNLDCVWFSRQTASPTRCPHFTQQPKSVKYPPTMPGTYAHTPHKSLTCYCVWFSAAYLVICTRSQPNTLVSMCICCLYEPVCPRTTHTPLVCVMCAYSLADYKRIGARTPNN